MKKYLNWALVYALIGLAAGVYYRELTRMSGFTGRTVLSVIHPHAIMLGMFLFLLLALFSRFLDFEKLATYKWFKWTYVWTGLPLMLVTICVRGTLQVLETQLSPALNASIAGIAGISHMLVAAGLILLILSLKKAAEKNA